MAPLLREAYIERDLAREAALDAVARIDRNRFDIELPPDGRIEAAHLRRFHPGASAALREALAGRRPTPPHSPARWTATGKRSRGAPASSA